MGVLTDIVVASAEEALRGLDGIPDNTDDRIECRDANPVMIKVLESILAGRKWESPKGGTPITLADALQERAVADDRIESLGQVFGEEPDGPWVYLISPELVSRLVVLDEMAMTDAATRCCQTGQFRLVSGHQEWELGYAREFIVILARLARRAKDHGKNLYMWMCV